MNIYENFTNMYQVNKTIRMGLEPIGKTCENIAKFLEEDKERSDKYKIAKKIKKAKNVRDFKNAVNELFSCCEVI